MPRSAKLALPSLVLGAVLTAASCGSGDPEDSFVLPRGATLPVRTTEAVSSTLHPAGSTFSAVLDSALAGETRTAVPAGASIDCVVDEIAETADGEPQIVVRAVNISLPNGEVVALDTLPISRGSRALIGEAAEIRADYGLEGKIAYLAETGGEEPVSQSHAAAIAIPAGASFVFTLGGDLVVLRSE